ncbi:MAG: RNA polymerase sigma factor (sigma-70 family) [Patiriisocius sp.]
MLPPLLWVVFFFYIEQVVHEDKKYIEGLLANDNQLIDQIYSRFSIKIKNYIIANSGSEDEAKDIFQESLISIYNRASKGDFKLTCPFEAYLFMVCRGKWLNVLKSSKKKKETNSDFDGYTIEAQGISDETVIYEEKMLMLDKKLNNLGKSCQDILKKSWSGFSMSEVADQLNISYAYARKKKSHCVAKLISLVKGDPGYIKLREL